jgi:LmbE family N-acetylglucosaminyl deacetylase
VTGRGEGDVFIDISDTIDLKIEALQKHVSQVGGREGFGDRIKERSGRIGQGKEMAYAEVFRVVTLVGDEDWEKRMQAEAEEQ